MALLAMVKQELQPLRDDLATIRAEMKEVFGQTYTREMVDQMFTRMAEDLADLRQAQDEMRKDTIDHREKVWSRIALVVSTAWALLGMLPHLAGILKP